MRVETRLGRGARSKEVGINGGNVAVRVDDNQTQDPAEDDPCICMFH